ncbi:MAG: hypothetical protein K9N09_10750 [Candidatus Cloacimonetes bacterium]|nr:hypothetical protein [Candidatus Cloacimonadota bacterium]MCF7813462.1 hypothetical protein [Candidatus Cloacimonadota bacterium]MCF7869164.1 hypothetical protein [Candidatus Cloacimonadota bacterium]MCF7883402.1 hypothetical protein [Candidatus Cloacimonadota bacterium]
MKKIFFVMIVITGLIFNVEAQSSDAIDSEKFYQAVSSILNSSDNYFKEVISENKVHGTFGNKLVNVDFPGAEVAYYEYWYEDGESGYTVIVQYFEGNNHEKASSYLQNLKNFLFNIKEQNKFGNWSLNEDINSNGTFHWIDMRCPSYSGLTVILSCSLYENDQNIELKFEIIEYDDY